MGDLGEYWRDTKDYRRQKKRETQSKAPEAIRIAEEAGLRLYCFDGLYHYRVNGKFDWWPSTGYWKSLTGKSRGHGVRQLIKAANDEPRS